MSDSIAASTFHDFFESKVDAIRDATAGVHSPVFAGRRPLSFTPVVAFLFFLSFFQLLISDVTQSINTIFSHMFDGDPNL